MLLFLILYPLDVCFFFQCSPEAVCPSVWSGLLCVVVVVVVVIVIVIV